DLYHTENALALVEQGLKLGGSGKDRCNLALLQGELLHDMGEIQRSMAAYNAVLVDTPDDLGRCQAWIGLAAGMRVADQYEEALAALEKAESVAGAQGLPDELARIHHLRGNLYFPLGRTEDCAKEHQLSLKFAHEAGSPESEARALGGLGDAFYALGRMRTAHGYFKKCLALAREHGFGRIEVANWPMIATTLRYLMRWKEGLAESNAAVEAAMKVGHRRSELVARLVRLNFLQQLGQLSKDSAFEEIQELDELIQHLDAKRFAPHVLESYACLDLAEGNRKEAVEKLEKAVELSRGSDSSFAGPWLLSLLASTTDDEKKRCDALREAESILAKGAVGHSHMYFYSRAIEAALRAGEWTEAERYAAALEDYTREEPLPWAEFSIAKGRNLAAFGKGQRNQDVIRELTRLREEAANSGYAEGLPGLQEALSELEEMAPRT
ncbi:MAG: tetratricopeptide repeat protein, partial [Kiloniellales bacterium]|nr:tetratricopeptide repeat protein [Kiloniellales bacterium]